MNRNAATQSTVWTGLAITLLLTSGAAMILADAPYLHDFGEWLYQSEVLKLLVAQPDLVPGYSINPYPVPNSLVVALLALMGSAMPVLWAGKVFLVTMLAAWYLVARRFAARHFEPGWQPAGAFFLLATMAFATFFWYGFVSYQLALLLFAGFLCIDGRRVGPGTIMLFSVLLFFTHGMLFLVFGLYLLVRTALNRDWRTLLALLPSTGLSLWFLHGRSSTAYSAPVADAQWSGLSEALVYKLGYPGMLGPFKNLLREDGSSLLEAHAWLYWAGFVTNFVVVGLIGIFSLWVFWNGRNLITKTGETSAVRDRALLTTAAILALLYLVAPYNFFGLFNPGGRLLLPAFLMILVVGGRHVGKLVGPVQWPIAFFSLLSCCSYLYLTFPSSHGAKVELTTPRFSALPGDSVFEFNRALYANTRYAYFNYRVFAFARRFQQLEEGRYSGLGLRVGLIRWQKPPTGCDSASVQCQER